MPPYPPYYDAGRECIAFSLNDKSDLASSAQHREVRQLLAIPIRRIQTSDTALMRLRQACWIVVGLLRQAETIHLQQTITACHR